MSMLQTLSHVSHFPRPVPSVLRLWHYHNTGAMGVEQDSSQAKKYLDQLEKLLSKSDIQDMKLALINDLKLLGNKLS